MATRRRARPAEDWREREEVQRKRDHEEFSQYMESADPLREVWRAARTGKLQDFLDPETGAPEYLLDDAIAAVERKGNHAPAYILRAAWAASRGDMNPDTRMAIMDELGFAFDAVMRKSRLTRPKPYRGSEADPRERAVAPPMRRR